MEAELPPDNFIVGDEAYRASNVMLTPWSGRNLPVAKDAFNFYQSRMRITIECAFGMLVQRWGVLWRPLRIKTRKVPRVIIALLILNNIATRAGLKPDVIDRKTAKHQAYMKAFPMVRLHVPPPTPGRRRDLESSTTRERITHALHFAGLVRPARSTWGLNRESEV